MKKFLLVIPAAIIIALIYVVFTGQGQGVRVHSVSNNDEYNNLYNTHNTFNLEINEPKKPVELVVEKYEKGKKVYSQAWLGVEKGDIDKEMFGFSELKNQICFHASFANSQCFNIKRDRQSYGYDLNNKRIDLDRNKAVNIAYFGTTSKTGFPINMNKLNVRDFTDLVLIKVTTK